MNAGADKPNLAAQRQAKQKLASTEIQESEHRFRRREAHFAEAQRLSRTGSFGWNIDTGELFWSAETYCILGYPQDTQPTLGHMLQRIHADDVALVDQIMQSAARNATDLDFEHRLEMPDGSIKHLRVLAQPTRDRSGSLEFIGAVMDITEKKEAEKVLQSTLESLRSSEHLARGQLAALASTLDSLAQEFEPEKLPKHVVTTILTQMGAQSVTIWERNGDALDLLGVVAEGRFKTRIEAGYFGGSIPIFEGVPPLWGEALGAGLHFVIENISEDPARVILADGRTALWPTSTLPPAFAWLKTHFIAWGVRALLVAPMMMAGKLAGIIGVRFAGTRIFGREEIELTQALAHQAMLAMKLMRLSQQSRDAAVMAERNRMARDIHDTLAQGFTGVIVQLEAAKGAFAIGDEHDTRVRIDRASELARASLQEARRSVLALRPGGLLNSTLCAAVESMLRSMTEGTQLLATFELVGAFQPLPVDWEENLLHIAQESLTNTIKHAAASNFRAEFRFVSGDLDVRFDDDGRGFDPDSEHDGFGLVSMKERVDRMRGQFTVQSSAGFGTQIRILLPMPLDAEPT